MGDLGEAAGMSEIRPNGVNVLVTGNQGYIGSVLTEVLAGHGYRVIGLDSGVFRDVAFVPRKVEAQFIAR